MKSRHHLYFDAALSDQLEALASRSGGSKSAIVADALRAWLARRAANEIDDLLRVRLDRISAQLNRIERDQRIVMESLGLFIRYQLTVTPPLPDSEQAVARAVGQDRFQAFIDQVGRRIAGGRSLAEDVRSRASMPEAAS
ncbi:ribbon-helix-helix domain-containing protein [Inquilinus sp. Marseille-Q2685]|uniref:ribbon-helix-helix domain-containing protein n=1 Tax=Inquilinus sp. Marseille-Q2685 TaxID=2866581 RepID=UPI001CE458EC|nr:ribbon-helix-helix domain-containing protein [Inquilinus sp. Marseille-Q2685]